MKAGSAQYLKKCLIFFFLYVTCYLKLRSRVHTQIHTKLSLSLSLSLSPSLFPFSLQFPGGETFPEKLPLGDERGRHGAMAVETPRRPDSLPRFDARDWATAAHAISLARVANASLLWEGTVQSEISEILSSHATTIMMHVRTHMG